MKKDLGPLSMGSGCLVSEMERRSARLLCFNRFFVLGNQDVRVFCLKDWLIFLGAVSYMVCERICFSIVNESVGKSLAGYLFKDGSRLEGGRGMPIGRNLGPDGVI